MEDSIELALTTPNSPFHRYLYIKSKVLKKKNDSGTPLCALFVTNCPPYTPENGVKSFFSQFGSVGGGKRGLDQLHCGCQNEQFFDKGSSNILRWSALKLGHSQH